MSEDVLDRILRLAQGEGLDGPAAVAAFAAGLRERARLVLAERVQPLEDRLRSVETENAWRAETIQGLEAARVALQAEIAWRDETIRGLEVARAALQAEIAWRDDTIHGLEASQAALLVELEKTSASLQAEIAWRDETIRGLEAARAAALAEAAWRSQLQAGLESENAWRAQIQAGLEAENAWRATAQQALEAENGRLKGEMDSIREERLTASEAHDRLLAHHRQVLGQVIRALDAVPGQLPWSYRQVREDLARLAAALGKEIG